LIDPNNDIDLEGKEWSFLSKSSLQCDSHSQTPSHKDHLSEWLSTGRVPSLMFENVTFQSDCTSNFGQPDMIVHWKHCPMCSFIFIWIGIPLSYQMNVFCNAPIVTMMSYAAVRRKIFIKQQVVWLTSMYFSFLWLMP